MAKKDRKMEDNSTGWALASSGDCESKGQCVEAPVEPELVKTPVDEEDDDEGDDYSHWVKIGNRSYYPAPKQNVVEQVPPGVYTIEWDQNRQSYYFYTKKVELDELFILPSKEQAKIINDIQSFWTRKEMFTKYKFVYKRGILLHGPAGCGKSSIINLMSKEIVEEHKGVVVYLYDMDDLKRFIALIPILKEIEPNKQILCILEDLETFTFHRSDETLLLNVLDGANQMDNIVYLGTTNYIEQLKERIINRPSRFDRRYYIGTPNAKVRKTYFKNKIKPEDFETYGIDLEDWVKRTAKLSIAHLGEVIKSVLCLGNTFDDTLKDFEEMKRQVSSFDYEKGNQKGVGFNRSGDSSDDYEGYDDIEEDYAQKESMPLKTDLIKGQTAQRKR